jgi:NDP-sugar pyrophosphorylase family protein
VKAVIVAGGKGTRLKPYTTVFPKPLMPIGNKPILEIIVRQLKSQNIKDIIILVGYLGELITAFFGDGSKFGVNIRYSKEEQPLGTVGGLSLIKDELDDAFIMINGDTLTALNFSDLGDYHRRNGAIATIALNKRRVHIDFGMVEIDTENKVKGYTEKPTLESLVSMGVNALSPEVLEYIEPKKYLDFPMLIHNLIANRKTVKAFIFDGYWLDIGRPDDYERANAEIEDINGKLGIG